MPILISGTLQNRTWTDNNNVKHYSVEVVADEVTFVERKTDNATGEAAPSTPTYGDTSGYEELSADDELPFD
jgi:single-stranded DNA-binding protein